MTKKFSGALDKWCANGAVFKSNGYVRKVGQPGAPTYECVLCSRPVKLLKDGTVERHVWQPVDADVDVLDRSTNNQSNRAQRAFDRTRRKA